MPPTLREIRALAYGAAFLALCFACAPAWSADAPAGARLDDEQFDRLIDSIINRHRNPNDVRKAAILKLGKAQIPPEKEDFVIRTLLSVTWERDLRETSERLLLEKHGRAIVPHLIDALGMEDALPALRTHAASLLGRVSGIPDHELQPLLGRQPHHSAVGQPGAGAARPGRHARIDRMPGQRGPNGRDRCGHGIEELGVAASAGDVASTALRRRETSHPTDSVVRFTGAVRVAAGVGPFVESSGRGEPRVHATADRGPLRFPKRRRSVRRPSRQQRAGRPALQLPPGLAPDDGVDMRGACGPHLRR
jgi:hypothetical protein